ncbi:hypothetical protein JL721_5824 [Aureococcus anophagefferens]|nr:hypothetical protein JL721_5824 [Aureococcus anophagefferens]
MGEPSILDAALESPARAEVTSERNLALPALTISARELDALRSLRASSEGAAVPVEWVVDVADNNLNWFIATAYSFDDAASTVRVAIPDREEPDWEGDLPLDHRTIHLIECCDDASAALYKHVVAAATVPVAWRVEWALDGDDDRPAAAAAGTAKYYGRLSNVVYVGDGDEALREVGVDENLKLVEVLGDDGGHGDFEQLVVEGIVQWEGPGDDGREDPALAVAKKPRKALEESLEGLERLAGDMSRCMEDALRMRSEVEHAEVTQRLRKHVILGDLDALAAVQEDADRDARSELAARRQDAQDATLGFVSRCEARFWRQASTGLFFRRRYHVGDDVEVVLCRGLESQRGKIAKAHDNETYDVDLEGERPEVGVQIPPEYLRATAKNRAKMQGNLFGDDKKAGDESAKARRRELEGAVADMLRERDALRSRLDALARERDHVEDGLRARPPPRTPSSAAKDESRRETAAAPQQARVWLGSCRGADRGRKRVRNSQLQRLISRPFSTRADAAPPDAAVLDAALPLLDGAGDDVQRLNGFDVVAVAFRARPRVVGRRGRGRQRADPGDGAERWASVVARTSAAAPPAVVVVLARRDALADGDGALAAGGGGRSASAFAKLRSGATLAFASGAALADASRVAEPGEANAAAAAMLADGGGGATSVDCCRDADHAFFLGDLGYGSDPVDAADAASRQAVAEAVKTGDWASLVGGDALKRERAAKRCSAGWETATPRFPPTAFLEAFDGEAYGAGAGVAPAWCERVLWKSLPGLRGSLRLELHDARRGPRGGRGAVVAAFSVSAPARPPGPPRAPLAVSFPVLRATVLLERAETLGGARDAAAALGPCYLEISGGAARRAGNGGGPRSCTSPRNFVEDAESLEPPPDPSASALWDDDDALLAKLEASVDPDDDGDHVLFKVLGRDDGALVGGALLGGRSLAKRLLQADRDAVDFEEPILLNGVLKGFLRGSAKVARDGNDGDAQTPDRGAGAAGAPAPAPETATPKGKSP